MFKNSVFLTLGAFVVGGGVGYYGFFDSFASGKETSHSIHGVSPGGSESNSRIFQAAGDKTLSTPSVSNLDGLLQRYAKLSPAETRDELLRLYHGAGKDNYQKDIAIGYLAFKLGLQSPDEVREILENGKIEISEELFSSLMCGWADKDVMDAMHYLLEHKREYPSSSKVFDCLVDVLVKKRPDKVISWSDSLSKGERGRALHVIVKSMGTYHPEGVAAFVSHIGADAWKDPGLFGSIGKVWGKVDWDGFETWANTLDEGLKKKFLRDGFSGLSGTDLKKATEKYYLQSEEDRPGIASSIILGMDKSARTSGRFLDWLNEHLKDGDDVNTVISSTLCMGEYRTPELIQHLFEMPPGVVRDETLSYLAISKTSLVRLDVENMDIPAGRISASFTEVLDMAFRISDQEKRDECIRECWKDWEETVSGEARQWLEEKSSFSVQDRQRLIQEQDARRKVREAEEAEEAQEDS